ncbi:MAG: transglutaminase family protein [Dysgonamonadaceae bacterium]|jgi:hypothetical protein|nr:transglutaminase family protein [Dysgonamonadaceae bacterium]
MKKFRFSFLLVSLTICAKSVDAQTYLVSKIPEELKKDAFSVVREYSQEINQLDLNNGVIKTIFTVTVLNDKGNGMANFHVYEDNFCELTNFSGEIFNAEGKSIKKIKKKDLSISGLSSHLATDGKHVFYDLHSPVYPFTVKYVYDIKLKNGVLSYPAFHPLANYNVAVEKAEYRLEIPADYVVREKKLNTNVEATEKNDLKRKSLYYKVENLKPLFFEPYSPEEDIFPVVYLSPEKFCSEKFVGDFTSWESFGKWQIDLLKDRNTLPQSTIDKVKELTKDAGSQREKAKILYQYLQNKTHYVSIQLGIGGWQPMLAGEVDRTGFGDCKALSNYMRALLNAAGIPSYYTVIRLDAKKKRLMRDFPNFSQNNHVILTIPFEKDSVYLECTSQILPFGYIHRGIAGHDALAVGDDEAYFITLPDYPNSMNREINAVDIRLSSEGNAEMTVNSRYEMQNFEAVYHKLFGMTAKEETDFISSLLHTNKPQISNIQKTQNLSETPSMELSYNLKCDEYASITGARMFIQLNPALTSMPKLGKYRRNDLILDFGLNETDTIKIHLPENYKLENPLNPTDFSSPYGIFHSEAEVSDDQIIYIQRVELFPGRFSVAEYEEVKTFYDKIESMQNRKIAIIKK